MSVTCLWLMNDASCLSKLRLGNATSKNNIMIFLVVGLYCAPLSWLYHPVHACSTSSQHYTVNGGRACTTHWLTESTQTIWSRWDNQSAINNLISPPGGPLLDYYRLISASGMFLYICRQLTVWLSYPQRYNVTLKLIKLITRQSKQEMLYSQSYRKLDSYLPKVPNSATKRGKKSY